MFRRACFYYASTKSAIFLQFGSRAFCSEGRKNRLIMYANEWNRQMEKKDVKIEKAIVTVIDESSEKKLLMNDHSSTFYDCLKHISKHRAENTALIAVETESDMEFVPVHSFINGDSNIHSLSFNDCKYTDEINKAYWRSCAFVLGAIVENSFLAKVYLKEAHPPHYEKGRFGYSAVVNGLNDWKSTESELNILTRAAFRNYIEPALPFQPLTVDRKLALEMFNDNPIKRELILNNETLNVTVYRMGDHIDLTDGPLIANTKQIGRFAVTKVEGVGDIYAFYGVSVPAAQACSSFSWDLIIASSMQDLSLESNEDLKNQARS